VDAQRIHVSGIVQGVGFRPFVFALARRCQLRGWVCNTSAGVDIEVEGDAEQLDRFARLLTAEAPPLARIDSVEAHPLPPSGFTDFEIRESLAHPGAFQPISPDVALCAACERELFDPVDRRYLYPFVNCTHCGPRFTIIRDLPYDRPQTSVAAFPMCPDCAGEYANPLDRRFHAQPTACPVCGPRVWLQAGSAAAPAASALDAILEARRLLSDGRILAVKGLGGFHLACDSAVSELRRRKRRSGKPLAVMLADLAAVEACCIVDPLGRGLLLGREKPIVLFPGRPGGAIAAEVAPGTDTLGVMLPYTPLHHLLLNQVDPVLARQPAPMALVMTSGNWSEEPIATGNEEALARLDPLVDAFLLHDRPIEERCDDSVVRLFPVAGREGGMEPVFLRRSRGYTPSPVHLPAEGPSVLAVGAELKNTFCLTRGRYAFLSQHIGDMQNAETLEAFEHGVDHFRHLFRAGPQVIAHDLHPDYLGTRWAMRQPGARVAVQHHHAHIAACMADNGLAGETPVIGLAFDGTGLGTDGTIWGGEVLIADYAAFRRAGFLQPLPLPGGDAAIRQPWRVAVAYARALDLDIGGLSFLDAVEPRALDVVRRQVDRHVNTPLTSSLGRLFDCVAALAGVRNEITYEAQAAMELETLTRPSMPGRAAPYDYALVWQDGAGVFQLRPLLEGVVRDVRAGARAGAVGARFHATLAVMAEDICRQLRAQTGLDRVALSGGVWQNETLLGLALARLGAAGFTLFTHRQTPANDGGLALGQAMVALQAATAGGR
jgi:hydrogenase maturation protein HypF